MDEKAPGWLDFGKPSTPVVDGEALAELELTAGGVSQEAASKLAALIARAAAAPTGMIHLALGDMLHVAGGSGLPPGFEDIRRAPVRSTLAGWVITHGHPLIVTDLLDDARVPLEAPARAVRARAYAGFPIRGSDGEALGVCAVMDYEPRPWTAGELAAVDEGAQACTAFVLQRRAQDGADRQRRFLDALLESLRTGVAACDGDGRLVFTNEAIRQIFGAPGNGDAYTWAEQMPLVRALAGERIRTMELTVPRPTGPSTVVLTDAQPILGRDGHRLGAVVTVHDVTEQRRTERFRQAELVVAAALGRSRTVVEAGTVVLRALARALRWPHAELWLVDPQAPDVLIPAASYTAPGHRSGITRPASLRRGQGLAGTAWETGHTVWINDVGAPGSLVTLPGAVPRSAFAVPIPSGGTVFAVLTCFADVFEDPADALVVLLSGIAAHIGQFLERRRAEELALALARSKDEYLALIGHELRTPLTVISAYIELLQGFDAASFDTDGRRLLAVMSRNSDDLRHIVDVLLDLAALDSGHAAIATDPVDLTDLVTRAVVTARPDAVAAGVALTADVSPGCTVPGDGPRLRQVVTHLLDNAIRHSTPGGAVTVRLDCPHGTAAELTVADTGIGIPDEEHHRIFERFYRSSRTRDHGIPGAGLGLALSRAIVERHHGSIRLIPQSSPGTLVVVRLPS